MMPSGDPASDWKSFTLGQIFQPEEIAAYDSTYGPGWLITTLHRVGLALSEGNKLVRRQHDRPGRRPYRWLVGDAG